LSDVDSESVKETVGGFPVTNILRLLWVISDRYNWFFHLFFKVCWSTTPLHFRDHPQTTSAIFRIFDTPSPISAVF
jgi:hypothetical protein